MHSYICMMHCNDGAAGAQLQPYYEKKLVCFHPQKKTIVLVIVIKIMMIPIYFLLIIIIIIIISIFFLLSNPEFSRQRPSRACRRLQLHARVVDGPASYHRVHT